MFKQNLKYGNLINTYTYYVSVESQLRLPTSNPVCRRVQL